MDKALFKKVRQVILVGARPQYKRRITMKMTLSVCVAVLIVFALSVAVHCQSDSLVGSVKTIDGHVISVDIQNSQIVVNSFQEMTFVVPASANITDADGFGIQLSDVNVGGYVTVGYIDDQSGKHMMKSMEVEYNS